MKLLSRLTSAIGNLPLFAGRKPKAAPTNDISASLGRVLRPQAAYRWLLPQLAAITPQYIEMTLRGALAGNHVQAWELFDLMEDTWPRLRKNAMELKNGVRNLGHVFSEYSGEEQEPTPTATEKMRLVSAALRTMRPDPAADESAFSGILFDIMDAWLKGVSVIEIDWERRPAGKLGTIIAPRAGFWVHPVCYAWSMEGRLGLRTDSRGVLSPGNISSTSSQPMPSTVGEFPPDKFLISICKTKSGSALGGALLRPLAWWWCAANFSADWLLNLAQVFGLPFRWATYDPNVPQATIDAICAMLAGMGSNAWAAFPTGTQLDLKEASKGGDHSPQGDLLDRADKQCDLLILGQTLTTEMGRKGGGGGSFAAAKVHEGVKGEIVSAAANFVAGVINDQLTPSILRLNYGNADESPVLSLESADEEDLKLDCDIITALAATPFADRIGKDFLGKKFRIPKPAQGEETLAPAAAPTAPPQRSAENPAPGVDNGEDIPPGEGSEESKATEELTSILAIENKEDFERELRAFAAKHATE